MENLLPMPIEMDFDTLNLTAFWKKWKQTMMLYLNAVMKDKSEEERYSTILLVIGERGREIFNTWTWGKYKMMTAVKHENHNIPSLSSGKGH